MQVDKLDETMTGTYLIETQGSKHLWNLDEGWYIRNPGRVATTEQIISEAFRGFSPDFTGTKQLLIYPEDMGGGWTVRDWPEVGSNFYVHLPPPNYWHSSSRIKSITKVD